MQRGGGASPRIRNKDAPSPSLCVSWKQSAFATTKGSSLNQIVLTHLVDFVFSCIGLPKREKSFFASTRDSRSTVTSAWALPCLPNAPRGRISVLRIRRHTTRCTVVAGIIMRAYVGAMGNAMGNDGMRGGNGTKVGVTSGEGTTGNPC